MIPFVGLTGGIASGKSTVSNEFAKLGVPIIDADEVGHELQEAGGSAVFYIRREFGEEYVTESGAADRDLLRQAAFSEEHLRNRLEAIMHPLIEKACLHRMRQTEGVYGILVAPLLFEKNFMLDRLALVLAIEADVDLQFVRGVKRGRFSEDQLRAAMKTQVSSETRRKRADDIIVNRGPLAELTFAVREKHDKYLALFA